VNGDSLILTSQDSHITKIISLEENTYHCDYTLSGISSVEVGMGLTVNMMNMFEMSWTENIEAITEAGHIGWKTGSGGLVLVGFSGAGVISQNSFLDSPARDELQERDSSDEEYPIGHSLFYPYHCISLYGENEFAISLTLQSNLSTEVIPNDRKVPSSIKLHQNYPNPFNSETIVRYDLPGPGKVTLKIYDCLGRLISILLDEQLQNPGNHQAYLNLDSSPSGIYFIHLTVQWDGQKDSMLKQKMVLLK